MPPRSRNPEQGGGDFGESPSSEAVQLAERHGISVEEATEIAALPARWIADLVGRVRPREEVIDEIRAAIYAYETAHGPHPDWDELRCAAGNALIVLGNVGSGIELLAGVSDIDAMAARLVTFLRDGLAEEIISIELIVLTQSMLLREFERSGRGEEFKRAGSQAMMSELSGTGNAVNLEEQTDQWAELERQRYPRATLNEIAALVKNGEYWPDDFSIEVRHYLGSHFAMHQHDMLASGKRKDVEELKECLKAQEARTPAELWDKFRLLAALSLYNANLPNFGRGIARSMTDEDMAGMVCLALVEAGNDHEAMAVAEEIKDASIFAKVLYVAEWQDRARIEALLTDMTVANTKNSRKYDPARRLGVAEGLAGLFAKRAADADEAGSEDVAAHWRAEQEIMEGRARLLRRQIESRYITAPAKKK